METDKGGSTRFDAVRYHHDVIRPLRATPQRLPQDLRVRYEVHDSLSDQALARHLDEVISFWAERSREQPDYARAVYVSLLKAHHDLLADPTVRLYSADWWSAYQPPFPDAKVAPAQPLLSDVDPYIVERIGSPLAKLPSDVAVEVDEAIGPDAAVDGLTTNTAGDTSAIDGPLADDATSERVVNRRTDRVCGLEALRTGDDVELSWVWPSWATEALVSWDSDRIRRVVDREKYRQTGRWRVVLNSELSDGEVVFSVAVRGATADRREWSEAVSAMARAPRPEVTYRVRRLWYRFPSRAYTVAFRTDRPPVRCDIMIGFSGAEAFPETTEACQKIDMAFLSYDRSTRLVTLPRSLGSGWLRCFLVTGESITLKDPDVSTLRIRSWIR